jgi:hypothetical protein
LTIPAKIRQSQVSASAAAEAEEALFAQGLTRDPTPTDLPTNIQQGKRGRPRRRPLSEIVIEQEDHLNEPIVLPVLGLENIEREVVWEGFADLFDPLPDDVLARLKQLKPIPDHIQNARQDCARSFLEEVMLPRLKHGDEISLNAFVEWLTIFKDRFKQKHPFDLRDDFSITQVVERQLMLLSIHFDAKEKTGGTHVPVARLIRRANRVLGKFLDESADILYLI